MKTCIYIALTISSIDSFAAITTNGCHVGKTAENSAGQTVEWSGACLNGKATGYGVLQWYENGNIDERYEGELKDGLQSGKGIFTAPDGIRYEGEWKDGLQNGQGIYIDENGDRYEGEFHNGMKHGNIIITLSNGNQEKVIYRNDIKQRNEAFTGLWITDINSGCLIWNGDPVQGQSIRWDGACLDRKATGKGTAQWYLNGKPDGRYEGEYKEGKRNGKGRMVSVDGSHYEGEWKDNHPNGNGSFTWADGSHYEGELLDLKLNGFGTLTIPRNVYSEEKYPSNLGGQWIQDKFVQRGYFLDDNFVEDCPTKDDCTAVIQRKKQALEVIQKAEKRKEEYYAEVLRKEKEEAVNAKCMKNPKCRAEKERDEQELELIIQQQRKQAQLEKEFEKAHECDHVYVGKFFEGGLFNMVKFEVVRFSESTREVTVRSVDGGRQQEVECSQIPH